MPGPSNDLGRELKACPQRPLGSAAARAAAAYPGADAADTDLPKLREAPRIGDRGNSPEQHQFAQGRTAVLDVIAPGPWSSGVHPDRG